MVIRSLCVGRYNAPMRSDLSTTRETHEGPKMQWVFQQERGEPNRWRWKCVADGTRETLKMSQLPLRHATTAYKMLKSTATLMETTRARSRCADHGALRLAGASDLLQLRCCNTRGLI